MVRASGLRGYATLMRELGRNPLPLLERYRISPQSLDDDNTLIPLSLVARLLEASAEFTGRMDFGLRMSQAQDLSVLGPLAIAIRNAPTVAQAMQDISSYLFMHSPAMLLGIHEHSTVVPGTTEMRFEIRLPTRQVQRQVLDLCLADLHNFLTALAGAGYLLKAVDLPHTPIAPLATYKRFFGAPVRVAQERATLYLAPETLAADLQGVDETLRQLAVDYLEEHYPTRDQGVSERVRQALRGTLSTHRCGKKDIAAVLAMHPRTLQRRLDGEGTSFTVLREEARKHAALRYLRETRTPLVQVAGLVGLSEQSALTRSCKRWFGTTPSDLRRHYGPHMGP